MSYKKVYLINLGLSSDYKKSKIIRNLIEKDFKNNSYKYRCDFQQIYDNHYGIIQIPSNAFECHLNELKKYCADNKIDLDSVIVVGSGVLDYYGIRESKDLDIIVSQDIRKRMQWSDCAMKLTDDIEIVSKDYFHGKHGIVFARDDELINNKIYHINYKEIKIVKMYVVWVRKYFDQREKDCKDIQRVHDWIQNG